MTAKSPSRLRLAATEFCAVTLWVSCSLFLFFATTSTLLHELSPTLRHYPPFQVFLSSLVLVMAVWELLGLSFGSPFNPSVTLALAIAGKLPPRDAAVMSAAQFSAHVIGVLLVRAVTWHAFSTTTENVFTPPQPHETLSYGAAVAIEAAITALLCVVVLSLEHVFPKSASVKKWSLMTALIVVILSVAGEWTGSCMNPAMSFALSILEQHWSAHGVYWVGPICGAVLAGLSYNLYVLTAGRRMARLTRRRMLKKAPREKTE